MLEWTHGEWYLSVECKNCGTKFAFQRDAETDDSAYLTDSGEIVLVCPDCHFPLPYAAEQIERIQAI